MAEETVTPSEEALDEGQPGFEEVADVTEEPTTTVWSPEPTGADEILNQSVEDWRKPGLWSSRRRPNSDATC